MCCGSVALASSSLLRLNMCTLSPKAVWAAGQSVVLGAFYAGSFSPAYFDARVEA